MNAIYDEWMEKDNASQIEELKKRKEQEDSVQSKADRRNEKAKIRRRLWKEWRPEVDDQERQEQELDPERMEGEEHSDTIARDRAIEMKVAARKWKEEKTQTERSKMEQVLELGEQEQGGDYGMEQGRKEPEVSQKRLEQGHQEPILEKGTQEPGEDQERLELDCQEQTQDEVQILVKQSFQGQPQEEGEQEHEEDQELLEQDCHEVQTLVEQEQVEDQEQQEQGRQEPVIDGKEQVQYDGKEQVQNDSEWAMPGTTSLCLMCVMIPCLCMLKRIEDRLQELTEQEQQEQLDGDELVKGEGEGDGVLGGPLEERGSTPIEEGSSTP